MAARTLLHAVRHNRIPVSAIQSPTHSASEHLNGETTMDLKLPIAPSWSALFLLGFLLTVERPDACPECSHNHSHRPVAVFGR
ncbi:MAG: hypothetical protein OXI79_11375 [Gammaproteobacteria bacterium]|nr:hypothetical protein [Gammaproteobacteria bacterium]